MRVLVLSFLSLANFPCFVQIVRVKAGAHFFLGEKPEIISEKSHLISMRQTFLKNQ